MQSVKTHVVLAAGLMLAIGAYEGARADIDGLGRGAAIVLGAAIAGVLGVLVGLVQAAIWIPGRRLIALLGVDAWWHDATNRDDAAPRAPVVALHAAVVGAATAALMFAVVTWVVVPRLVHLDDEELAQSFGLLVLLAGALGVTLAGFVAARAASPAIARVDARVRLPWPDASLARYAVWIVAPIFVLLVPYLLRTREELGVFALPFWAVVFFVTQGFVFLLWRTVPDRVAARGRILSWGLLGAIAMGLIASVLLLRQSEAAVGWTRSGGVVGMGADVLRRFGDVDRDGYSAWLGGGDCAPLDGAVNPGARDEAGNGIDENCDGSDAEEIRGETLAAFSDALPKEQVKAYNVVLVIVDAVRFDHTGIGGYDEATTPYLDALAEESLVFTRAFAQAPATALSVPSILTGRDPSAIEWRKAKRLEPTKNEITIAHMLAEQGYQTGIVAVKDFAGFLVRMREAFDWDKIVYKNREEETDWYTGRAGAIVTEAIHYIEQRDAKKPFFLTVYIPEPHAPYDKHGFGLSKFGKSKKSRYDGEIANADRHIGFLVEYLKYQGFWDDTIVVVTSDHGEEFNEHGGTQHARTCYVESTHVPLVVHVPGLEPSTIDATVALVDIVPTILELVGAGEDVPELQGQSLLTPVLAPSKVPEDRLVTCTSVSLRAKQGNFFRRSLRGKEWLLVHEVLEDAYELYDVTNDPKEETNVFDDHADDDVVANMRASLNARLTGNLPQNLLTD